MSLTFRTTRNLGLSILLFIIISISLLSYQTMSRTATRLTDVMTDRETRISAWSNLLATIKTSEDYMYRYSRKKTDSIVPIMSFIEKIGDGIEQIRKLTPDKEELACIEQIEQEYTKYRQAVYLYVEEIKSGYRSGSSANEMEEIAIDAASVMATRGHSAMQNVNFMIRNETQHILKMTAKSKMLLTWMLMLSVIGTVLIALFMNTALARPILKLVEATNHLSDGDLNWHAEVESSGEIGQLASAFNKMADDIRNSDEEVHASLVRAKLMAKSAKAANEAKSLFLANMSHELRTPMNAVIGFGDILIEENLTNDQINYVNMIRDSSRNLLNIINDILDFSKIEAGELNVEYIDFSLVDLLDGIDSLIRPSTLEKGLKFDILHKEPMPSRINSDQTRIRQCLINLTSNAVKFTETGHVHLTVSTENKDGQPFVNFEIEDTGIGIPADKQKIIFDSFNQADNTHTRKYGGTGLGLAITKQLTELLGGELSVTSIGGNGSTFKMTIPTNTDISDQPLAKPEKITLDNKTASIDEIKLSGHILLAEDSVPNQTLMKILLEKVGLKLTIAEDGGQAVQKALEHDYDLILMDMQMPVMNGDKATIQLREKGLTTPIVALTANAMDGDDKKCIEAGCDAYLPKPVVRESLMNVLSKYLCLTSTGDRTS